MPFGETWRHGENEATAAATIIAPSISARFADLECFALLSRLRFTCSADNGTSLRDQTTSIMIEIWICLAACCTKNARRPALRRAFGGLLNPNDAATA